MGNGFESLIPNSNRRRDRECSAKRLPGRAGVSGAAGGPTGFWQSCAGGMLPGLVPQGQRLCLCRRMLTEGTTPVTKGL